jgi:hypothetical protein
MRFSEFVADLRRGWTSREIIDFARMVKEETATSAAVSEIETEEISSLLPAGVLEIEEEILASEERVRKARSIFVDEAILRRQKQRRFLSSSRIARKRKIRDARRNFRTLATAE